MLRTTVRRAAPALFSRTAPRLGGGELKVFKEKVLLYTKLKKNIQTFKNVTMAKYLKAQERLANRDASLGVTAKIFSDPAFNKPYKPGEVIAHLVITTNRGTCGSLNARQVQHIGDLASSSYNPRVVLVGKKGQDSFPALVPQTIASGTVIETDHNVVNAEIASRLLLEQDASRYRIMYTRFITVARQDWSVLTLPSFEMFVDRIRNAQTSGDITYTSHADEAKPVTINNARLYAALNSLSDEALKEFYEFHVLLAVNYAMEENVISEFAARVVAVENQLQNISKLRDWAQNMYNKTRQTNITAELLELTSAAAAMEEAMIEEAKLAKATSAAILAPAEREYWCKILDEDLHAIRMEIAFAEQAGKTAPELTAQADEYARWRDLLEDDELKPRLASQAELKDFLENFASLYADRAFARRFAEEIKASTSAAPKPAVAAAV